MHHILSCLSISSPPVFWQIEDSVCPPVVTSLPSKPAGTIRTIHFIATAQQYTIHTIHFIATPQDSQYINTLYCNCTTKTIQQYTSLQLHNTLYCNCLIDTIQQYTVLLLTFESYHPAHNAIWHTMMQNNVEPCDASCIYAMQLRRYCIQHWETLLKFVTHILQM